MITLISISVDITAAIIALPFKSGVPSSNIFSRKCTCDFRVLTRRSWRGWTNTNTGLENTNWGVKKLHFKRRIHLLAFSFKMYTVSLTNPVELKVFVDVKDESLFIGHFNTFRNQEHIRLFCIFSGRCLDFNWFFPFFTNWRKLCV